MPGSKPKAGGVRIVNSQRATRRRLRTRDQLSVSPLPSFQQGHISDPKNNLLLEPPSKTLPPPASREKNVLELERRGRKGALAQPAPDRSPSTTPHRNLRAPPAAPATTAPPAPVGLSSPGAGAAGGSNDDPAEAAGLELSSLSRSSSAAWLSFCTILLPLAAATSAGPPRPPSVGPPARSPTEGLGSKRAPLRFLPLPPSALPPPSPQRPECPDEKGGGTSASPLSAAASA